MEAIDLVALVGAELHANSARKLQPAVFLAQRTLQKPLYSFSLSHGRVHSEQLDSDLVFFAVTRLKGNPGSYVDARTQDASQSHLMETVNKLLKEHHDVLEAAATRRFFQEEGLGDPSSHLSWFNALPQPIRERAAQVEELMA